MTRPARRGPTPVRERAFHEKLARTLPAGRTGLLPIGDDATALKPPPGRVAVVSTDTLVEGTHFLPDSPPERVGGAATAVSLSDVAAKGAAPDAILLALVLPVGTPAAWAEAVVRGAERFGARFGAHVVGGDTKPGPVRAVVSTVLGWGREAHLAPRTGARPGDLLVTTGTVGRGGVAAARLAAAGPGDRRAIVELLDVRPRVREGIALAPLSHALIDTSDGLAEAARLLARASGVSIRIDEDRLPWAPGLRALAGSGARRREVGFYGGDYELLAAIPARAWPAASRAVRQVRGRLTRIGVVGRGRGAWLYSGRRRSPMPSPGWQPFGPERALDR
ncbi:MAG TPA: thiamine-phosphate kinase [Thermoplasmata archaeon]|nr:thiamine-phosphate kinase [Thermoplasmata archaeon]